MICWLYWNCIKKYNFLFLGYIENNNVSIHLTLYTMQKFNRSYRDLITGIVIQTCGVSLCCADLQFCKVLAWLYDDFLSNILFYLYVIVYLWNTAKTCSNTVVRNRFRLKLFTKMMYTHHEILKTVYMTKIIFAGKH